MRSRAHTRLGASGGANVARTRARTASTSKSSVAHAGRNANGQLSSSLTSHAHASWYGLEHCG